MKSHIILTSTVDMNPEEWISFRSIGLGASDCSTVLGLNSYKSSIQLFYEKLGQDVFNGENIYQFMGKTQEDYIANLYQYWGGDEESLIKNFRAKNIVRRVKKVNAYVQNPAYPWLFCSLDREINKHGNKGNGTLECKKISGRVADKWESGFPVGYVPQINQQMLLCEYEYGDSAILKDGTRYEVLPFEFNTIITETIVRRTKIFWDKVLEGRKIMTARFEAARTFNQRLMDECDAELQKLEPEADGSEAYTQFMKEKYKIAAPGEMSGTLEDIDTARKHKDVQSRIKELEEQKRLHENVLKNRLREGATKLDFGLSGYVSWQADANGTRRFLNKVK